MAVDVGLLAGKDVDTHDTGPVGAVVGADPDAGAVRGDNDRVQPHRVVTAVEGDDGAQRLGPRLPLQQLHVTVGSQCGGKQVAVAAGPPACSLAGVLRHHGEFTGGDVQLVGVHQGRCALVGVHHRLGRIAEQFVGGHRSRERGQIDPTGLGVLRVGPEDVPVLVAAGVLQVEQPAGVPGPLVMNDAAGAVGGNALRLAVEIVHVLDPDVEAVPPRRQVGDTGAVG